MRKRHRWLSRERCSKVKANKTTYRVNEVVGRRNQVVEPEVLYSNFNDKASPGSLPTKARAMLALQIVSAGFGFDVILYLNRTHDRDELWLLHMGEDGLHKDYAALESGLISLDSYLNSNFNELFCYMVIARQDSEEDSSLFLLSTYCRGVIPFSAPGRFIASGLVSKGAYDVVISAINDEIAINRADAENQESEIIETARKLGLKPEPPFLSPWIWSATCPGTRHKLYLSSKTNTFGCGYCGRKGGQNDLEQFVRGRRRQAPSN
jgi:hypothetical protein